MRYLTTTAAAEILRVTPRRIRALIESGKLPAERMGRDWAIKPKDLDRLKGRTPGRPRKVSNNVRDFEENYQHHDERQQL